MLHVRPSTSSRARDILHLRIIPGEHISRSISRLHRWPCERP